MSNIMAAIGIEQLKRFSEYAEKRRKLAKRYDQLFASHPIIQPVSRDYDNVVPHLYVVRILGMNNRNDIQQCLLDTGIQTGCHYQPNHWLSYFRDDNLKPLPVSDLVFPELLSLPLHPDISEADVEYVAGEFIGVLESQNG